jgi:DNA-binding NarL/FixJ family response regulator
MPTSTEPRVRVLIADDHAHTRAGIRMALEADGFEVCAEAATGRKAVELAKEYRPEVALLDIQMPDGTGIWAAYEITEELPETVVVMLTYSREDDDLFGSLRAGAVGYLLKDTDPERLAPTLRAALAGEVTFPRSLMSRIVGAFEQPRRRKPVSVTDGLTEREQEVAELLRRGSSTEAIAETLAMAPTTVRVHISNIVKKLRVGSRAEAARLLKGM